MINENAPPLVATDLEGILIPEIWVAIADTTGVADLRLTTRDVADYDDLMKMRLDLLVRHQLRLHDIQAVIATLDPLPGAVEFLDRIRGIVPVIVITDSYYEFVQPLLPRLGYVTMFGHSLVITEDGSITGYRLRVSKGKRRAVRAFHALGFRILAIGDSYNDINMLLEADEGILYRPPPIVCHDYPHLPVVGSYAELTAIISNFVNPAHVASSGSTR